MRTARSTWSGCGAGSLKKIITPSPAKCSSVPPCSAIAFPIMRVVLAQHAEQLLRIGLLGEES